MRLERLNDNKIKVFLPFDDLFERGLTKEDLWKNAPQLQDLIHDLMHVASHELNFEADGPLAIEIYSLQAQGMTIIVTKDNTAKRTIDEEDDGYFDEVMVEMEVTLGEHDDILYEFVSFEDVISLAKYLYPQGFAGGSLFSFQNRYYLLYDEEDLRYDSKDNFIAMLAEFGNSSTMTKYRLMEYGKEVFASKAMEEVYKYFN